jgi:hypothetical protein
VVALDPELMDRVRDGDDEAAIIGKACGSAAEAALKVVVTEALHQHFADLIPNGGDRSKQFYVRVMSRAIERRVICDFIGARHDERF